MAGIDLKTYRDGDDLLTGGLGEAGLRAVVPPPFVDAANPTREERRRRAIWSNWRGGRRPPISVRPRRRCSAKWRGWYPCSPH